MLAIGGSPGEPYVAPEFTEEGAPDPVGSKHDFESLELGH